MKPVIIIAIAFVLLIPVSAFAEISITNDGGNCSKVGDWDVDSKTCTLNMDINETILVNANYVTVDGNNHQITGYGNNSEENNKCISADAKIGIVIKNFKLTNCAYGIHFQDVLDSEFVGNEIFDNYEGGIYFTLSNNNIIKNNKIYDNYQSGILFNGNGNLFEGNEITNNTHLYLEQYIRGWGISGNLKDSANIFRDNIIKDHTWGMNFEGVSAKNEIQNNTISYSEIGIRLNTSEHFLIIGNVIQNNEIGIESVMFGGSGGKNTIKNNLIVGNGEGIYLKSQLNILTENTISDSSEYGLWIVARNSLTQDLDNKIFNNNFINNSRHVFHGEANFFTMNNFGNYWGDFSPNCVDANSDKICDEPYPFSSGIVGVVDDGVWVEKNGWLTATLNEIMPEPIPESTQIMCTQQYDPVCGISGETFSNMCVLESAGGIFDYKGECIGSEPELQRKILCEDGTIDIDGICQVEQIEEEKAVEKVDVSVEKPAEKSVNWFSSFFDWLGELFK